MGRGGDPGVRRRGREIDKERGELNLWRWFRTSRQSELLVIFGEDLAAIGGLTVALGFVGLAMLTGDPMWDAIGSICIGSLLVMVAILVGIEVKALLVGQSADPQVRDRLLEHLESQPHVRQVYSLITQQLGNDLMVAVKARMRSVGTDVALVAAINETERSLRSAFPQVRWLFFEPDVAD
jgi:divalent metal cation (Fe/Co/Zn/Cd) transporter